MVKTYVGITKAFAYEVFKSGEVPTERTHGHLYSMAIGPFKTMQGAQFMAEYGRNNPHVQSVYDAENLARYYKARGE